MTIYVNMNQYHDQKTGKALYIEPQAVIEHSPRECLDNEKLAALERELTELLTRRLRDAIKI